MVKICGFSYIGKNSLIETSFSNPDNITSIVNDLKINNGVIFDTNEGLLGVVESGRVIYIIKDNYVVCGYSEEENTWYYREFFYLDDVHDYLEDKDILIGYVFDSSKMAYKINENALISII